MQVDQPLYNLPGPPLEHLLVHVLVLLAVPAESRATKLAFERKPLPSFESPAAAGCVHRVCAQASRAHSLAQGP